MGAKWSAHTGDGERERMLHLNHPLELLHHLEADDRRVCRICSMILPQELMWTCVEEEGRFHVHKYCLDCLPNIVQYKQEPSARSSSDFYTIGRFKVSNTFNQYETCVDCNRRFNFIGFYSPISYTTEEYLCVRCCLVRILIEEEEESPSQVPRVIRHFFHPCDLELIFSPSTTCNACFANHSDYAYHCKDCDFLLDFECAHLPKVDDDSTHIHHFCHWHPLQLFLDGQTLCKLCESSSSSSSSTTSNSFYGCTQCQFYAHKSCVDNLPQKTVHPSLYQTVVLLTVPSYVCATCNRACSGLTFYSGYNFCVKCILWPSNESGSYGGFKSIHHRHQLTLRETDQVHRARCFMCGEDCSGWNYESNKYSTYFHKSCAELPRIIQHPMHPSHPLTLAALDTTEEVADCKLCLKILPKVFYGCESCSFSLDSHCASFLSSIQYQGHPHRLYVLEHLSQDDARCNKCSETLPKDSPLLYCAEPECEFGLHLLCGPLPCKIKDPIHAHPLTLQEYYVEDNVSDVFACHVCEEKRNPRLRVYTCTEGCLMTCDVECVRAEVVASLRGERGVLELDTAYPKVACKMITRASILKETSCVSSGENVATDVVPVFSLKELIESAKPDFESEPLEEEEGNNKLNSAISDLRRDDSSQSDNDGRKYHYSRKAFKHLIKNIEGNQGTNSVWNEFAHIFSQLEGSRVGGYYLLPNTLDSVYSNFFAKHTLFGPDCKLNHDRRRLIVFYICSLLHDMRMTKTVDVSAERIASWSSALKAVRAMDRYNGLQLDFLFKHVTRIAEDHYMVRAVDIIEDTFSKLCKKKEDLSAREKRLMRKLAKTRSDIEDNKEELRSFRAYRAAGASETKKEYYASLENKWRPCYEC